VGAIAEVLRDGRDALLVEPENPEAIANAVVKLLDDRALAERLVECGRRRVGEEFDEHRGVEAFAAVVEQVLRD
jgi:glycosyltransferase involved in cell wall biosynthesis